nr:hypothetical protein TSUD_110010 [Ipomoea batatas]
MLVCMEEDDDGDESMQMDAMNSGWWWCIAGRIRAAAAAPPPPPQPPIIALGFSEDESLVFGESDELFWLLLAFFNLFLIVEFQKFLISLSVLPGRRAAI